MKTKVNRPASKSSRSKIEWTDRTWNPTTGCTKISAGCKNCYAEPIAHRFHKRGLKGYENNFKLTAHSDRLDIPLKWRKPLLIFVNSMSDLFHEDVPDSYIEEVFSRVAVAERHTFQVLTKRPDRMKSFFTHRPVPKNAWLGVSVEDRRHGLPRIDILRSINAPVRFLSVEPLLEDLGRVDLTGIHWVIVGGESGPRARPMDPAWAIEVRDQALAAGVPFFFKQWGTWGPDGGRRSKEANGRDLEGRTWDEMPPVPG